MMTDQSRKLSVAALLLAMGLLVVAATPANAFLDKLFGDEEKPVKQVDKFEPADPAEYQALAGLRKPGLALARSSDYGILPPSPLTAYVNGTLEKIVKASPVPDIQVHAVITPQRGMQAQATPHGIIYIAWEMLKKMHKQDELAAILSHELAHVLYRHHDADWFTKAQQYAAQSISLVDQYKGMLGKGSGTSSTAILVDLGAEVTNRVIAPNLWTRSQEDDADLLGIDILVKAGYNAELAIRPLNLLAEWQEKQRQAALRAAEKKKAGQEKQIEDSMNNGNPSGAFKGIFNAVVSGAGEVTDTIMKEIGGEEHHSPERRRKTISAYIEREHPETFDVRPKPVPWDNASNPMAMILKNYETTWKAWSLVDNDLKGAERLIRRAVRGPTVNDTLPRYVFAQIRKKGGKKDLYERNLELALKGKEPGFIIFRHLVKGYASTGRMKEASRTLTQASKRLGDPPHLMPYRIALMIDAKRKGEAMGLHATCKINHHEIAPSCDRALKGLRSFVSYKDEFKGNKKATERLIEYKTKKAGVNLQRPAGNSSANEYTD